MRISGGTQAVERVNPPGWKTVAAACADIEKRLDELVDRVVSRILDEIPAYRRVGLDERTVGAQTRPNVQSNLRATVERRGPTRQEIATRRTLGRERAAIGLPAEALLQAFQIGIGEVWQELIDVVNATGDPDAIAALLDWLPASLSWANEVTSAIAADHREAVLAMRARTISAAHQLLALLQSAGYPSTEAHELAARLGLDRDGLFRAWCLRDLPDADGTSFQLDSALSPLDGTHVVGHRYNALLLLTQGAIAERVDQLLDHIACGVARGRGLERRGLRGAQLSLLDARQAAGLSQPYQPVAYEDAWLETLALGSRDQLAPLLERHLRVAEEHPGLAAAVVHFVERHSASAAGKALALHPNTISYRLDRWKTLTGGDPRSGEEVALSYLAARLAVRNVQPAVGRRHDRQPG